MRTLKPQITNYLLARDAFFLAAQVEGKSKRTLELYETTLKAFESFLEDTSPLEATSNDIRRFLLHLEVCGFAKATIYTHQKQLRVLYNFFSCEGHLEKNPMEAIRQIRLPRFYPYVLSEEDVLKLLRAAKGKSFLAKRNFALISLFLDTGIRVSEANKLTMESVNIAACSIKVKGKGGKERTILFGKSTAKAILSYLKARGSFPFEDHLFVSRKGEPLERCYVGRIIRRLGNEAGIQGKRISPHTLRHTFATLYIKRGGSPFVLQRLLGHADIKTVMLYVNLVGRDLRDDYFKHSPIDGLSE